MRAEGLGGARERLAIRSLGGLNLQVNSASDINSAGACRGAMESTAEAHGDAVTALRFTI